MLRKPPPATIVANDTTTGPNSLDETSVEGKLVDEHEIKAYLAGRLAKYKALDGGVVILEEIPRNASGKAMKHKLKEMMMSDLNR